MSRSCARFFDRWGGRDGARVPLHADRAHGDLDPRRAAAHAVLALRRRTLRRAALVWNTSSSSVSASGSAPGFERCRALGRPAVIAIACWYRCFISGASLTWKPRHARQLRAPRARAAISACHLPRSAGAGRQRGIGIDRAQRAEEAAVGQHDRDRDIALETVHRRRVMRAPRRLARHDRYRRPRRSPGSRRRSWS
jgi:hypothetical protein